jgi:hypothetical protein
VGAKKKRPRTVTHRAKAAPLVLNCYAEVISGRRELAKTSLTVSVSPGLVGSAGAMFQSLAQELGQRLIDNASILRDAETKPADPAGEEGLHS